MAVGDALAPGREVGLHAHHRPRTVARHPQARAHVVDDQQRPGLVGQLAAAARIGAVRGGLVDEGVVLERGGEDRGQVLARLRHGRLQAGHVVVVAEDLVRAVGVGRACRPRRAPGRGPVIGALGPHDGLAPGVRPRGHQRHGRGVGAVLAEHRPVRVADQQGHLLGQPHHQLGRPGQGVADPELAHIGRVDLGMAVAEEVRAIGAHQVEVALAVGVPDVRAVRLREELRIVVGQQPHRLVAVHPAGDHRRGAFPQGFVQAARHGGVLRRRRPW